MKERSS